MTVSKLMCLQDGLYQGRETGDCVTSVGRSIGMAILEFKFIYFVVFPCLKRENQQIKQLISCVIVSYKHHLKTVSQNSWSWNSVPQRRLCHLSLH